MMVMTDCRCFLPRMASLCVCVFSWYVEQVIKVMELMGAKEKALSLSLFLSLTIQRWGWDQSIDRCAGVMVSVVLPCRVLSCGSFRYHFFVWLRRITTSEADRRTGTRAEHGIRSASCCATFPFGVENPKMGLGRFCP